MIFQQVPSGGDRNFGYLVGCENSGVAAVVDPSPDPFPVWRKVEQFGFKVAYVINTHSHPDHAVGNRYFKEKTGASVIVHKSVSNGDIQIENAGILKMGKLTLMFIHTPGHTPDSICVKIDDELITVDTLFVGKVGGTSSVADARNEFDSLKKLMELDDRIRVWPGHDYGIRPSSTIAEERASNPFILRLTDFEEFIWLKDNWLDYKREHHIQ
jgi:hydroxyacylglutathione hydrolase